MHLSIEYKYVFFSEPKEPYEDRSNNTLIEFLYNFLDV